ncbi:pilus assembly protein CpaE [Propioniciclava soli]|uniref:Pilus assembly protein CpaE n=1 Tax=Propioniciclava soli TaxID=2775081 RepID=A0ABZ3C7I7_9ACTN|nr:pilus assembly protein CpaE [Propioniciclava soli]
MIALELAHRLDAARRVRGEAWTPTAGDRFVIPGKEIDDVFVVADMTIEVEELSSGAVVKFNGTTEWALDSLPADEVLWLPREPQLRAMLAERFVRLERLPGADGAASGYAVLLTDGSRHVDVDPEDAYARAVLHTSA